MSGEPKFGANFLKLEQSREILEGPEESINIRDLELMGIRIIRCFNDPNRHNKDEAELLLYSTYLWIQHFRRMRLYATPKLLILLKEVGSILDIEAITESNGCTAMVLVDPTTYFSPFDIIIIQSHGNAILIEQRQGTTDGNSENPNQTEKAELRPEFRELLKYYPQIIDLNITISRDDLMEMQSELIMCHYMLNITDEERNLLVRSAFWWRIRHDNRILMRPWENPLPMANMVAEIERGAFNGNLALGNNTAIEEEQTPEVKFDTNTKNDFDILFMRKLFKI